MNPLIAQGQWYRLVSCTFLHANVLHLFTNCQVRSGTQQRAAVSSSCVFLTAIRSPCLRPQSCAYHQAHQPAEDAYSHHIRS